MIQLDDWQMKFLHCQGNKILCCGRQVGKTEIVSIDASNYAISHPNETILMIAPLEKQAYHLFTKTLNYLSLYHKSDIKMGRDKPTKTKLQLKNGSKILCLPVGQTGLGVRFLTVNRLYVDEAHRVPESVWTAVTPTLFTTGGSQVLLSTPAGDEGYFKEAWESGNFKKFEVSSEEVAHARSICPTWSEGQRASAIAHLELEKKRLSKMEYAQEYLGKFMTGLRQLFKDKLIEGCMVLERSDNIKPSKYYMGCDIARLGGDETTFEILEQREEIIEQSENLVTEKTLTTQTFDMVNELNRKYNFKNIGIDDGGIGAAIFDFLVREPSTSNKVIALNNARRSLSEDAKQKKKLMKEDMYMNLLRLMEQGKIKLLKDPEILLSLKSVQYEYITDGQRAGQMHIFGKYTHIAEGLIRAAWLAVDRKSLNLWAAWS